MARPPMRARNAKPRPSVPRVEGTLPRRVARELDEIARPGQATDARAWMERFNDAQAAGKLQDARRAAINAKKAAPRSPFVREALGLASYDLEQWHEAAQELLAYRRFAGDRRHDPVVADCYRRLGNAARALDVLDELRRAGPPGAVQVEGQIVRARVVVDAPGGARQAAEIVRDAIRGPGPLRLAHEQLRSVLAEVLERSGIAKNAPAHPSGFGKL